CSAREPLDQRAHDGLAHARTELALPVRVPDTARALAIPSAPRLDGSIALDPRPAFDRELAGDRPHDDVRQAARHDRVEAREGEIGVEREAVPGHPVPQSDADRRELAGRPPSVPTAREVDEDPRATLDATGRNREGLERLDQAH